MKYIFIVFTSLSILQSIPTVVSSKRSGSTPSLSTSPPSSSSSIHKIRNGLTQTALSVYLVTSELTSKFQENIWQPTRQFWKDQEEAALERRLRDKQQKQKQRIIQEEYEQLGTPMSSMSSISTSSSSISSSLSSTLNTSKPKSVATKRSHLSVLVLPTRLFKISFAAWCLAEVLERGGILNVDTPGRMRHQMNRVWYDDIQPKMMTFQQTMESFWYRRIRPQLASMAASHKTPFAIGTASGMLLSPVVFLYWQPIIMTMCIVEWNGRQVDLDRWNIGRIAPAIGKRLKAFQASIHRFLRKAFLSSSTSSSSSTDPYADTSLLLTYGGGIETNRKKNYLFWTSRRRRRRQKNEEALLLAIQEHDNKLKFQEMLRHGMFMGTMLGLLFGL